MIFNDMSPFEQMGLYKYVDPVVTHRYHDAVFAFQNGTPVLAFPEHDTDVTIQGESRLHSLFKSFGIDLPQCLDGGAPPSTDYGLGVQGDAIAEFRQKRTSIEGIPRQHRLRYESLVARSVAKWP